MRGDVRGIDISRVILVYVFTASIMLGATAQNPTSIVASTITNKIKNPATITATAKKTLKTIKTLAPTVATTVATTVAKPTVLSDKKPTTLPHMENDRAKADIKDGYTSLKKAQLPDVAKELTENTRVHIEAKDIKVGHVANIFSIYIFGRQKPIVFLCCHTLFFSPLHTRT